MTGTGAGRGVLLRLRGATGAGTGTHGAGAKDAGVALVMVVGSMLVLAMLALTALAYTMSSQKFARQDQDYSGAMSAAQSGVDDFIGRLNRNDGYFNTLDCTNVALQGPTTVSNTCGWTATTPAGWLPVDAARTGPMDAWFHYSIDATNAGTEGTVALVTTGRANGQYRTVEAAVGKGGSTDFVYYTDFESGDPSNVQIYKPGSTNPLSQPSGKAATADCGKDGYQNALHWWEGRYGKKCAEITFGGSDKLDGAVFSNDAVQSAGASFLDGFKSANPPCSTVTGALSTWKNCLRNVNSTSTADFNNIRPAYSTPLYLDDTSAAFALQPGCHYLGSTRIVFAASGKMTVWNKTVNNGGVGPTAVGGPAGTPTCGTLSALDSAAGATVDVPDQMVIYVGTVPAPSPLQCNSGELGGPSGRTLPLGTYDRAVHKITGSSHPSYTYDTNMIELTKPCQHGNLYVEGVVSGRVSLAAAQSIVVTGDVVLAGGRTGSDLLGLVATNSVEVMHARIGTYTWVNTYADCKTTGVGSKTYKYCLVSGSEGEAAGWPKRYTDPATGSVNPASGIQIAGSIQTLQHSMFVQKFDVGGDKGVLNVFGSIAQRWRGAVGTSGGEGYDKLYQYDRRLKFAAPPYFPRWINAQWSQRYFGEIRTPAGVKP